MTPAVARYHVMLLAQSVRRAPPMVALADPSMSGSWWRVCHREPDGAALLFRASVRQGYAG